MDANHSPFFMESPLAAWLTDPSAQRLRATNYEATRRFGVNVESVWREVRDALPFGIDGSARAHVEVSGTESEPLSEPSAATLAIHQYDGTLLSVNVKTFVVVIHGESLLYWVLVPVDRPATIACSSAQNLSPTQPAQGHPVTSLQSRAHFFSNTPLATSICTFDDGRWVHCNTAMMELLGIPPQVWRGQTSSEMELWNDPLERSKLIRLLVEQDAIMGLPITLKHRHGHTVDATVSAMCFYDDDIKYTLAHYWANPASIERPRHTGPDIPLPATAPPEAQSAAWVWELKTDTLQLDQRGAQLLGQPAGELQHAKKWLKNQLHPDDLAIVTSKIQAHLQGKAPFVTELRLRSTAGVHHWFRVRAQAERDPLGHPFRWSGTIQEPSELRYPAAQQRRLNERLALASAAVGLGTWEVFPDGKAVWDAQTFRLYGHDPATATLPEVIYRQSVSPEQLVKSNAWLANTLQQTTYSATELRLVWPDGQVRWIAAKGISIRDTEGRPISLLGVNWDITEQKQASMALQSYREALSSLNQQLMEQEKEITKTLAYSLHDQLGQTLTALRFGVDTLRLRSKEQHDLQQHCELLDTLTGRAIQEVRDALTRLRPPMLEDLGLGRALDSEMRGAPLMAQATSMVFVANPNTLAQRWPANVEYVCFMIAREAIANALKHAKGSSIEVCLESKGTGLLLTITDDGPGITPPIFQPRRGHLGLLSMRERAHAIDAQLIIESSPYTGTCITLQWPQPACAASI